MIPNVARTVRLFYDHVFLMINSTFVVCENCDLK